VRITKAIIVSLVLLIVPLWILNTYIVFKAKPNIHSTLQSVPDVQHVLVLGASVYRSQKLSPPLEQRMLTAIHFHLARSGTLLVLSGHSIKGGYNEPLAMSVYATQKMVLPKDLILDYKGVSTYTSLFNFQNNYPGHPVLIVTQAYHLPRAIYIAKKLGLDAHGLIAPDANPKLGRSHPSLREVTSRFKDFFLLQFFSFFK